jgi:hypothetical protein
VRQLLWARPKESIEHAATRIRGDIDETRSILGAGEQEHVATAARRHIDLVRDATAEIRRLERGVVKIPPGWAQTPAHLRVRAITLLIEEMHRASSKREPEALLGKPPIVQKVETAFRIALVELNDILVDLLLDPEKNT